MEEPQASFDIPALRARLLGHLGPHADIYPVNIEQKFPRILAKIVDLWGTSALDGLLFLPTRYATMGILRFVQMPLLL